MVFNKHPYNRPISKHFDKRFATKTYKSLLTIALGELSIYIFLSYFILIKITGTIFNLIAYTIFVMIAIKVVLLITLIHLGKRGVQKELNEFEDYKVKFYEFVTHHRSQYKIKPGKVNV